MNIMTNKLEHLINLYQTEGSDASTYALLIIAKNLEELTQLLKKKTKTIEETAIETSLKEPVADLIRAMVENEFPEDEQHT